MSAELKTVKAQDKGGLTYNIFSELVHLGGGNTGSWDRDKQGLYLHTWVAGLHEGIDETNSIIIKWTFNYNKKQMEKVAREIKMSVIDAEIEKCVIRHGFLTIVP